MIIWIATLVISFCVTFFIIPPLISELKKRGIVGIDVNKKEKPEIPEMGGMAVIIGLVTGFIVISLLQNLGGEGDIYEILAINSVIGIAGLIGFYDDIRIIKILMAKSILVCLASIPLIMVFYGETDLCFTNMALFITGNTCFLYWFILVPIGISGAANALNMSAGYNGLESGEVCIISFFLLVISIIKDDSDLAIMLFGALLGSALALFYFNRFPAKIFVGDVGTLGMGAAIGTGVIIGKIEIYGVILILPMFYELFATIKYRILNIYRKPVCMEPVILDDGTLKPPEGAQDYTLFFLLLSKGSLKENELVHRVFILYLICGCTALILSLI